MRFLHLLLLQVTSVLCPENAATRLVKNLDAYEALWAISLRNGHTRCRSLTLDLHDPLKRARPDHLDVRRGAFSGILETMTALTPQSIIPIYYISQNVLGALAVHEDKGGCVWILVDCFFDLLLHLAVGTIP